MIEKIKAYLKNLEEERQIKILLACETGSRAWGFPSVDSDYDIRLIYVHKLDWYLSLHNRKDNLNLMLDNNDVDITGWDLQKSFNLLKKSNPPMLERIQSDMIYMADEEFTMEIVPLAQGFYSKIATMHHYLSMAVKFKDELGESHSYRLKKFFYALRSALVCKWILDRDEIPPLQFGELYKGLDLPASHQRRIEELIELKMTIDEKHHHSGEAALIDLMEECIQRARENRNQLPSTKGDIEELDKLFRKYIRKYDY